MSLDIDTLLPMIISDLSLHFDTLHPVTISNGKHWKPIPPYIQPFISTIVRTKTNPQLSQTWHQLLTHISISATEFVTIFLYDVDFRNPTSYTHFSRALYAITHSVIHGSLLPLSLIHFSHLVIYSRHLLHFLFDQDPSFHTCRIITFVSSFIPFYLNIYKQNFSRLCSFHSYLILILVPSTQTQTCTYFFHHCKSFHLPPPLIIRILD